MKESEGPVEHLVKVGTHAKVLEELHVASKPAKVKGKPGRRKQKVAVEDLDEDAAEPEEHAGDITSSSMHPRASAQCFFAIPALMSPANLHDGCNALN